VAEGRPRRRIGNLAVERLDRRRLLSATAAPAANVPAPVLTTQDVSTLLDRAARMTPGDAAIVAVVDTEGRVLGVRVEGGVSSAVTGNTQTLVFSIDGALAEARTGAMFSTSQTALTSRTAQDLAQSTITQREVQSNPDLAHPNSPLQGPGFVAPIGLNAHFPPRIKFTPEVGPFEIEHTNRDSIVSPGPDHIRGTADDITLRSRFNANPAFIPAGESTPPPESYGYLSGLLPDAQSRGLGTLPGGIPLYKGKTLVGGIGVFFPGTTGYATEENSSLNGAGFFDPTKPDLAQEAEYIAFVAAGGSAQAGLSFNTPTKNTSLGLAPLDPSFNLPFGRIDVNGVTLDIYGGGGLQGPSNLVAYGSKLPLGDANSGVNRAVDTEGDQLLAGQTMPDGWLVLPHASADGTLTATDVNTIIQQGIRAAEKTRSGLRLPLNSPTQMEFAVTDETGEVLGLYRMPDAQTYALDDAVAKARNVAYYDNPSLLQPADMVAGISAGVAFTTRTFRYLAGPRYPEGIDGTPPGPFSILNETGVIESPTSPLQAASSFQSVVGFDAFNPQSNFHDPDNVANQSGISFSPGGVPLYKTINGKRVLVGGLGVSGDLPDQNDTVAASAVAGYEPQNRLRVDQYTYRAVRLPYQKFSRNPDLPAGGSPSAPQQLTPITPAGKRPALTPTSVRRILNFNKKVAAANKSR
jgi:uncharacterized protein GlcG (DUF336 family)